MVVKRRLTHINPLQKKPNAAELNTQQTNIHIHTHQSWYNRVIMYKMTSFLCICGPDCIRKYELTQSETPPISRKVLLLMTAQRLCLLLSFGCSHRRRFMLLVLHTSLFMPWKKLEKPSFQMVLCWSIVYSLHFWQVEDFGLLRWLPLLQPPWNRPQQHIQQQ